MQVVYERCAGLTIHKKMVEVCVFITQADGIVEKALWTFSTMITDLLALEECLGSLSIERIAIESAGEHWYLVYNLLREGRHILLIQPQQLKALSEPKTGVKDCEWLADLLRHDQLKNGFVPPWSIHELCDLLRYRKSLIAERAQEVNHLQKILERTTINLETVATNVLGKNGYSMIKTIIGEQQDTEALAELARGHLQPILPALRLALDGQAQLHQQTLLQRILAHMEFCEESLSEVQKEIEQRLACFEKLVNLLLQSIPCMHLMAAITILSEIGTDMSRFPTHKHLTAWAGVYPGNKQSGGKRISSATASGNLYLQATLSEIANAIANSEDENYLTMLYQRTTHWRGKRRAIMEVAYTILVIIYYVVRDKKMYKDGASYFDKRNAARIKLQHIYRLEEPGYIVPLAYTESTRETRTLLSPEETRSNVWRLFCIWAWIGLTSFGGGASSLLQIQREFTEKRCWVTSKEFLHFWNLCQMTPGTSQIALSILIGRKLGGTPGIIASLIGLLLPSTVITYLLASGFQHIDSIPAMQAVWRGVIPATSGLMFLVSLRLARPLITRGRREGWSALSISLTMILACVVALLFFKVAVIVVLLAASLAGIILFTTIHSHLKEDVA
ncbi:MAG: IS110 family transposase [Chloroflexi bacterium]|nr:IS110 family transposase [Chloroflexota bacterium]